MVASFSSLSIIALVCVAIAVLLLAAYLIIRPPLDGAVKLWLLFALGVFPIGAAFSGNVEGFETTKARAFCGSCHVMKAHAMDSNDLRSSSLASRHARNELFGDDNCYACHADYGMYGTVITKLGGMRHVWMYYGAGYRTMSDEEARRSIHLLKPYPNDNCMQCHSTNVDVWLGVPDHAAALDDVRRGRVSCASGGCHGFAHPFTKSAEELSVAAHADAGVASSDGGAR